MYYVPLNLTYIATLYSRLMVHLYYPAFILIKLFNLVFNSISCSILYPYNRDLYSRTVEYLELESFF